MSNSSLYVEVTIDENRLENGDIHKENLYRKYLTRLHRLNLLAQQGPSLQNLSEQNTQHIIHEFLDWYNSLGGAPSKTNIDENTLNQLFELGFDIAPKTTVKSDTNPPKRNTDFSPTFASAPRAKIQQSNLFLVLEGIEDLSSTKAFIDWLRRNSKITQ